MARSIRVAAVQLAAHDRDAFERTLDTVVDAAARAARDADLVVLPEATFPAYVLGQAPLETRETDEGVERLRAVARETRTVIVAGAAMRRGGQTYNAAVAIDPDGSVAGYADKLFLWHFDRRWFARGAGSHPYVRVPGCLACWSAPTDVFRRSRAHSWTTAPKCS